jgi:hypothetical protein
MSEESVKHAQRKRAPPAPTESDLARMEKLLETIEKSLLKAETFSKNQGFQSCERTLLHMISHLQTLNESLKSKKPGFA